MHRRIAINHLNTIISTITPIAESKNDGETTFPNFYYMDSSRNNCEWALLLHHRSSFYWLSVKYFCPAKCSRKSVKRRQSAEAYWSDRGGEEQAGAGKQKTAATSCRVQQSSAAVTQPWKQSQGTKISSTIEFMMTSTIMFW